MSMARVIEAVDLLEDGSLGLAAALPVAPPDHLSLDGFEERLDGGVIIEIALAAH